MAPVSDLPFVSVVSPFYNCDEYLAECIESVLAQTYKNFEFVLVNNCSTDRSRQVAEKYAAQDSRVRLYDNPTFLSQVQNHNRALTLISGESEYCKIVQADDAIYPTCLEEMVRVAARDSSVGIVGAYTQLEDLVYLFGLPYGHTTFSGKEIIRRFLVDRLYVTGSPTATMIRSDIVRNRVPFYDERSPVEDVDVCFDILETYNFGYVHQVLTYTRRNNVSIMSALKLYQPSSVAEMIAIKKYGNKVLDPATYARCLRATQKRYYLFLAESLLRGRGRGFWAFHDQGLRSVGDRIRGGRLAYHMLLVMLDLVLNPKMTIERILHI